MVIKRAFRHIWFGPWQLERRFPGSVSRDIADAVKSSELLHRGEMRVVVEHSLPIIDVFRGVSPRQRAVQVFSELKVWDTAENTGILLYVLLADRDLEIVADRGIAAKVGNEVWSGICSEVEAHYRNGAFREGTLLAIERLGALLAEHFPVRVGEENKNELPDSLARR